MVALCASLGGLLDPKLISHLYGLLPQVLPEILGLINVNQAGKPKISGSILSPVINTPGTAGGPGGRDRTLDIKSRKNVRKITFFSLKNKIYPKKIFFFCIYLLVMPK